MKSKIEIIANIILIIIGLIGGTLFYLKGKDELSLVFFSISLAAILYQFLGGIKQNNEFNLGAIKFGSSAAVLIGFMFFFKKFIFTESSCDTSISLSEYNWVPVDSKTGDIIKVQIAAGNESITFPVSDTVSLPQFKLKVNEKEGRFKVGISKSTISENNMERIVGDFTINDLETESLYNFIDIGDEDLQIFKLYKDVPSLRSTRGNANTEDLPFEIRVSPQGNFSIVPLEEDQRPWLKNKVVNKRTTYLIEVRPKEFYLVMTLQANHQKTSMGENYSQWLVKKIEPKFLRH
ncbi:MAG: hypothetical protein WBG46_04180 [Nonlabens sp.]